MSLYGGFDWHFGFNYIHAGFKIQQANLNVAFEVFGEEGYTVDYERVLSTIELPGLNLADLLKINPYVQLKTKTEFELSGGSLNIGPLGVEYSQQEDMRLEIDFLNWKASQSGWTNLAPQPLRPNILSIPSSLKFTGSFGPLFGIDLQIFGNYCPAETLEFD